MPRLARRGAKPGRGTSWRTRLGAAFASSAVLCLGLGVMAVVLYRAVFAMPGMVASRLRHAADRTASLRNELQEKVIERALTAQHAGQPAADLTRSRLQPTGRDAGHVAADLYVPPPPPMPLTSAPPPAPVQNAGWEEVAVPGPTPPPPAPVDVVPPAAPAWPAPKDRVEAASESLAPAAPAATVRPDSRVDAGAQGGGGGLGRASGAEPRRPRQHLRLAIGIMSGHAERRQALRATWLASGCGARRQFAQPAPPSSDRPFSLPIRRCRRRTGARGGSCDRPRGAFGRCAPRRSPLLSSDRRHRCTRRRRRGRTSWTCAWSTDSSSTSTRR